MLNTGFELPTRSLPDRQWSLRWPCCRSSFWRPWPPPGRPGSSRPWPCGGRWSRLRPTGWKWHWAEHSPEKVTIRSLEYKLNVTEHVLNPEKNTFIIRLQVPPTYLYFFHLAQARAPKPHLYATTRERPRFETKWQQNAAPRLQKRSLSANPDPKFAYYRKQMVAGYNLAVGMKIEERVGWYF